MERREGGDTTLCRRQSLLLTPPLADLERFKASEGNRKDHTRRKGVGAERFARSRVRVPRRDWIRTRPPSIRVIVGTPLFRKSKGRILGVRSNQVTKKQGERFPNDHQKEDQSSLPIP